MQPSTSQPPAIKSRLGAILRATSGNFLEQFDFFLFGFYATYIGHAFFPNVDPTAQLLSTFGVFWLGFCRNKRISRSRRSNVAFRIVLLRTASCTW